MNDTINKIRGWAAIRGLTDPELADKQLIKLGEEFGELAEGHNKRRINQIQDSLGDMFVVMTIYAWQNGLRIENCVEDAYKTIADRRGKLVNGVFIKDGDQEIQKCG